MGRLMRGGACAAFLAGITGIYLVNHGFSLILLSDGLTLAGLLLMLFGGLLRLIGAGALDGILYCGHALAAGLIPGRQVESYRDFVTRRGSKPRPRVGMLLTVGAVAILLGLLLM